MAADSAKAEKQGLEPPPNYADRSTQWRLLGIVGMVMAAFLLVKYGIIADLWGLVSGNPDTWAQFTGKGSPSQVDTKLPRAAPGESPLDEPSIDAKPPNETPTATEPEPEPKPVEKKPEEKPVAAPEKAEPGWLPGLDPKSLEVVEDNTVIRGKENDAWYGLCALVAKAKPEELAQRSLGPARFVQLYQQPAYYRGKVVTLSGSIRSAAKLEASKNGHEVTGYTKCVLFPGDGSNSPIVIYVMEMPAKFPLGEVREDVTIYAVSYKKYAYMAQDVPRTAPLLVARTIQWTPVVPKAPEEVPWTTLAILVIVAAALGITIAIVALRRLSPQPNDEFPAEWNGLPKEK